MNGEVDPETTAYVERLRVELPAHVASYRGAEVEYFGGDDLVPDPHDLDLWVDVREDGLPDLVIDHTIHTNGREPPRLRARFRVDAEWRRMLDVEAPGGLVGHVACQLVMGGAYEAPPLRSTAASYAAVDAVVPDASTAWRELATSLGGRLDADGELVVGATTVLLTSTQWRGHLVATELEALQDTDHPPIPGRAQRWATEDLESMLGARFVVWWRDEPHPSRRRELPPV